jgi:hypothetical protein
MWKNLYQATEDTVMSLGRSKRSDHVIAVETANCLNRLTAALAVVNVALEEGASRSTRRGAARSVHRALRKLAEADSLWAALVIRAASTDLPFGVTEVAVVEAVGDLLTEQLAAVLVATGYRTPPEPTAHGLIDQTRAVVCQPESGQCAGAYLESARGALREFVQQLAEHLPAANDKSLTRWLVGARKTTIAAALLCTIVNAEVKTGDAMDVNVGVSLKDKVKIELTVPKPWHLVEADTLLVGSAAAVVEKSVASVRAEAAESERWSWSPIETEISATDRARAEIRKRIEQQQDAEEETENKEEKNRFTSSSGS